MAIAGVVEGGYWWNDNYDTTVLKEKDYRREAGGVTQISEFELDLDVATPDDTILGGISGIVYNSDEEVYYALTDDVDLPRFYTLQISYSTSTGKSNVEIKDVTALSFKDGTQMAPGDIQPQAIAYYKNRLFVAHATGVTEFKVNGRMEEDFVFPSTVVFRSSGIHGLSIAPGGDKLYAATYNALVGEENGKVRVMELDLDTHKSKKQFVYQASEKVVGIVALDTIGSFLVLERIRDSDLNGWDVSLGRCATGSRCRKSQGQGFANGQSKTHQILELGRLL